MEIVKQIIPLLLTLSLGLLMVSAAMASSQGEFVYVLRRPRLLIRAIAAVDVVPVIGAMAVVALFPLIPTPAKAAILLMAISPVPPLVPGKSLKFGGRQEYVLGLQAALGLLAIVTVPLLGVVIARFYGSQAQFPPQVVAGNVAMGLIVPLIVGLALGRWLAPESSRRAAPMVGKIGTVLMVLAFLPIIIASWPVMMALVGDGTVLAIALVVSIAIAGGWLLGERDPADRSTLAFAAAMRHPGISLALASANNTDKAVSGGVLLFMLTGMIVLIPFQLVLRRGAKSEPQTAET